MKILFSFISTVFISALGFSQSGKVVYATKLSSQLKYADAFPVWDELASSFVNPKKKSKNIGDWSYVSNAAEAAFYSEHYERSLYWNQVKINKNTATEKDFINALNLLCMTKQYARLDNLTDTALMRFPGNENLMSFKKNIETINFRTTFSTDYKIKIFKQAHKAEEFGAVPYKSGILYVSTGYMHGARTREYDRTNQNFTELAYFDANPDKVKPKFYQKPFWVDFFYKGKFREFKQNSVHDGPISFNADKSLAFLTTNQSEVDTIDKTKFSKLKISVYQISGDTWTEIDFPFNSPSYSTGHATMDSTGTVYFVSNRPESIPYTVGGKVYSTDIYKTTYIDGEWSELVHLDGNVNSSGDESFPFISSKGILYFSSNGWYGLGGLDIFATEFDDEAPIHLGVPLNSNSDDFAYYVNEETAKGYFSSNRENWVDQIYSFDAPVYDGQLIVNLKSCKGTPMKGQKVYILDIKKKKIEALKTNAKGETTSYILTKGRKYKIFYKGDDVNVGDSAFFTAETDGEFKIDLTSYFKKNVSKLIAQDETGQSLSGVMMNLYKHDGTIFKYLTDANGSYSWRNEGADLIDSVRMNLINHEDGFLFIENKLTGNCVDTVALPVQMKTKIGDEFIRLDMVLYNFDKSTLRPEGMVELDKLVTYMKERPELRVELSSHTDSRGSFAYNITLSNNRSQSCVNYIISKGINKKMIVAKGYGETKLLNNCSDNVPCSIVDHQANRRTELKLLTPTNEELNNNQLDN